VRPVPLGDRESVLRQLEQVQTALDCRDALPAFFAAPARAAAGMLDEVVVIAHADSIADPSFRAGCRLQPAQRAYLVALEESGALRVFEWTARGLHAWREAQLRVNFADRRALADRPAYYEQPAAPLQPIARRQGHRGEVVAVGVAAVGIVVQSRHGRSHVLRLDRKGHVVLTSCRETVAMVALAPVVGGDTLPGHTVAELGEHWLVHYDACGLLHFVPRNGAEPELSVALTYREPVQGWCSATAELLHGASLAARLREIAESCR
jgi:hypothetical protein